MTSMTTRWNKRKRDDWDEEDAVDERPGAQVLPVARSLPSDGIPRDGSEYLLAVRMAAEKLPAFTKVINPYFELYDNHPPAKRPRSGTHPALPSDEWKSKFSARLLELRKNICHVELSEPSVEAAKKLRLPGPKDRPGWQRFIFGEPAPPPPFASPVVDNDRVEGVDEPELLNTQPVIDLDVNDASTSDEENGPSHGKTRLVERDESLVSHNSVDHGLENTAAAKSSPDPLPEPTLALLRRLNQHTVAQLLLFYEYWLREALAGNLSISIRPDGSGDTCIAISRHHSKWLFGLIARYDNDVMDGKEVSALRSLARVCIATICWSLEKELLKLPRSDALTNTLDTDADRDRATGRTSLWMVVAAVASVWGQSDIWGEANEKLHSMDLPLANT